MDKHSRRLDLLLICNFEPGQAQTCKDHIKAFDAFSRHNVQIYSGLGDLPDDLELERYDGVILHFTISVRLDSYLSPLARYRLRCFDGHKSMFIQDEYREINDTIEAIDYLGIDMLFTCVPEGEIEKVYPPARLPNLKCINVLTGYVPQLLLDKDVPSFSQRTLDIGYRGRVYPAWHGQLGREKWMIADFFLRDAPSYNLTCDISTQEKDRIYGGKWIDFLSQSKAVLAVESGASIFDFTGQIAKSVEAHVARQPEVSYAELRRLYFADEEGSIRLNQISPRCFEAAALRTLIIAYEGEYSGVLEPWRHFIPLKKDHSNMDEVVAVLRDKERSQMIIKTVYDEVACNEKYSYSGFMQRVDSELLTLIKPNDCVRKSYDNVEFISRFGRYDRPLRSHLLRSSVIRKLVEFSRYSVLPLLPRRLRPAATNMARKTIKMISELRAKRRLKVPTVVLPQQLKKVIRSPQEQEEVVHFLELITLMSRLSIRINRPIIVTTYDKSTGCVSFIPGTGNTDQTSYDQFETAIRYSKINCIQWDFGSRMGLGKLTRWRKIKKFPAIVGLLQREPDLIRFFTLNTP